MTRKNRTPEENAHRQKIGALLQMTNIGSYQQRNEKYRKENDRKPEIFP